MNDLCVLCVESPDYCRGHSDYWMQVANLLNDNASDETLDRVKTLLLEDKARWQIDPQVQNVFGLVKPYTNNALMVVYVEHDDFECAAEFFEDVNPDA